MLPNDEEALSKLPQAYDSSFKEWITKQARAILPLLVEGVEYEENLDVQVILPTMRADKVFKVRYDGEEYILHLEFEASSDPDLRSRLLVYNAVLYRRHGKPVITLVIYPFSVTMAESPLVIGRGEREIHRFRFRTLSLGTMDAETCVRQHHTCLYPLLPTMHGLHADLMTQVLTEMSELYREHEETFSQQFTWIKLLLERTDTIQPLEKGKIWERLIMFDRLWEESPMVQKTKKQSYEQGRAEGVTQGITQGITQGVTQGEVQTLRRLLVKDVQRRFPELTELAQEKVKLCEKPDVLESLYQQVQDAADAKAVQQLLVSISEQQL